MYLLFYILKYSFVEWFIRPGHLKLWGRCSKSWYLNSWGFRGQYDLFWWILPEPLWCAQFVGCIRKKHKQTQLHIIRWFQVLCLLKISSWLSVKLWVWFLYFWPLILVNDPLLYIPQQLKVEQGSFPCFVQCTPRSPWSCFVRPATPSPAAAASCQSTRSTGTSLLTELIEI